MPAHSVTGSSDWNLLQPRRPFGTLKSKQMLGRELREGGVLCTLLPLMCRKRSQDSINTCTVE